LSLLRIGRCKFVVVPISALHQIVAGRIGLFVLSRTALLVTVQFRLDRSGNSGGDFVLHGKHVVDLAVVSIRPELKAGRGVGQARRDAHAMAGFADAAFEHIARAKLPAGFDGIDRPALVDER